MTIHQLPDRCWELQPPADPLLAPHYDTEADALRDLAEDRDGDSGAYLDTKAVQFSAPCWVVQCDGECETVLDTEDEGYVFHHDSRADAEQTAAGYHFAADDGRVFCEEDAPRSAVPMRQEIDGQLALPGVAP